MATPQVLQTPQRLVLFTPRQVEKAHPMRIGGPHNPCIYSGGAGGSYVWCLFRTTWTKRLVHIPVTDRVYVELTSATDPTHSSALDQVQPPLRDEFAPGPETIVQMAFSVGIS